MATFPPMEKVQYDIIHAEIAMMRTTSKEVYNSPVFTGVNHLIIKHDQTPFVHTKLGILLQSRRNSLDEFNVWHGD